MLKTIIIGVLVSILIWAVTFDYFFDSNREWLSVAIAVAIALIIVVLFRALIKPGAMPPSISIQLIVIALGTLVGLFAVSFLLPTRSCPGPIAITVSCEPAAATPDEICADPGSDIEWITAGIPDGITAEIHDFKKKRKWPFPPKKESPLESDPPPGNNGKPITGKIKQDKKGEFKYSVTCTPEGGQPDTNDPVIDVPKGGGGLYKK